MRRGELKNFTGVDAPYEAPEEAELAIKSGTTSPDEATDNVVELPPMPYQAA